MVEKYIGGLGANAVEKQFKDLGIEPLDGNNNFTYRAGTEPKAMVNEMVYFNTPYNAKDELVLNLLNEVINNRITDVIREKMSAIYGGGVGLRLSRFPKERFMMQSYLPCGPENAEKVKVALWDILAECKKPGNIQTEELTKATETAIQKYKVNIKTNSYWLSLLTKYQQYGLPTEHIHNYETRIKAVTTAELTAAANKYLSGANVLHAMMLPEKSN